MVRAGLVVKVTLEQALEGNKGKNQVDIQGEGTPEDNPEERECLQVLETSKEAVQLQQSLRKEGWREVREEKGPNKCHTHHSHTKVSFPLFFFFK